MGKTECNADVLRQRAIAGDSDVVSEMFTCFSADLAAFLRHRCGHQHDADDAIQDAFEAAARHLATYRGDAPVKNWLYRLAANACTRMRRGRKNQPFLHKEFEEGQGGAPTHAQGPSENAIEAAVEVRLRPLRRALTSLGPHDRAVLLLSDGAQMTAKETAEALGLSESAVKSRLFRARRHMREQLGV